MKQIEKILLSGFVLTVIFSFLSFDVNSNEISNKVLRLHVLANSDSEYDQRVKLEVKDEISALTEALLTGAKSKEESQKIIGENIRAIESTANQKLAELNTGYQAKAYLEKCYFPTREYGDFTLPAGEYEALRVLIGQGSGKNWWCVVYPSLCSSAATETSYSDFSQDEKELIKGENKLSFKFYEWYKELLAFLQQ